MAIRIVRLGTPRTAAEGVRIGTVHRPPRGVAKERFAAENWYDVWYPELSPSVATMTLGKETQNDRDWAMFVKKFRSEMNDPSASRTLDLLAALSHSADFSIGCYCEDDTRCHRSVLRALLSERKAKVI